MIPIILLLIPTNAFNGGLNFHAVIVEEPWPSYVFIPQGSSVLVSCTANRSVEQAWAITLPGTSFPSYFTLADSIALLNGENIYNTTEIIAELELRTIRLFINNTEGKNGTKIQCVNTGTAKIVSETTLIGELKSLMLRSQVWEE